MIMNETSENKQSNWGGKRENAGRKKKYLGKYYGFNSTMEVDAILQGVTGNKTDFINEAILHFAKFKELI